jgi:hypothetical protein
VGSLLNAQRWKSVSSSLPWRRPEPTRLVLGDLARQEGASFEVIVIDQNAPPMGDEIYGEFRAAGKALRCWCMGRAWWRPAARAWMRAVETSWCSLMMTFGFGIRSFSRTTQ